MGEAIFEVRDAARLVCDHPECDRLQRYAVRLMGSGQFPRMVCRYHKRWAKSWLIERADAVDGVPGAGGGEQ